MASSHALPAIKTPAARILTALHSNGFVSTKSLAAWLGISRDLVIDAFHEIEAAGVALHRTYGIDGGAELARKKVSA